MTDSTNPTTEAEAPEGFGTTDEEVDAMLADAPEVESVDVTGPPVAAEAAPAKVARTRKARGTTTDADRLARAAKADDAIAARKAEAKPAAPAKKAAEPKAEAPAFKPASKADAANVTETNVIGFPVAPWIPEALRDRVGTPLTGKGAYPAKVKGYFIRIPFASFGFAARMEDVKGSPWLVVCEHGTTADATGISTPETGCEKVATRRAEWCERCAADKANRGTGAGRFNTTTRYGKAVEWIAHNDDADHPLAASPEHVADMMTVVLVADMFDRTPAAAAADVITVRAESK